MSTSYIVTRTGLESWTIDGTSAPSLEAAAALCEAADDAYVLLRDGAGWYIDSTGEHYARVQACWRPDDVVSFNGRHWRRAGRFIRMDRAVRIV